MQLDTEAQRIAITAIRAKLQDVAGQLLERKKELEKHNSETAEEQVNVAKLRMDVLLKIDQHLLEVLQEQYEFIERGSSVLEPGDMLAMWEDIDVKLRSSLLQGL